MFKEERTEQATPRKRQDAREKGQVAKSMDLTAALGLLAALLAIKWIGPNLVNAWHAFTTTYLGQLGRHRTLTDLLVQQTMQDAGSGFLRLALPLLLTCLVVGTASNLVQTGFVFSTQGLKFDFARMNPLQGIGRMFSARAGVELLKSAAKAVVLGGIMWSFFMKQGGKLVTLITLDSRQLGPAMTEICLDLLMKATMVLLVIAGLDYFFQRWDFEKNLRMTKQEVKEEYKRMEGDPQVKGRIRQRQREAAQRRMMSDVPKATVVITNPTHYAVALRYEPGRMDAPIVVAKGQQLIALKIKEIAKAHRVPIVENKPLARALFAACEIGQSIPVDLYETVAGVIAFVFRQSGRGMAATSPH